MLRFGSVHGAVSLPSLYEVIGLRDLLSNQIALEIGTIGRSRLWSSHRPTLTTRAEVYGYLEHLALHSGIALVIGHRRKRLVGR